MFTLTIKNLVKADESEWKNKAKNDHQVSVLNTKRTHCIQPSFHMHFNCVFFSAMSRYFLIHVVLHSSRNSVQKFCSTRDVLIAHSIIDTY